MRGGKLPLNSPCAFATSCTIAAPDPNITLFGDSNVSSLSSRQFITDVRIGWSTENLRRVRERVPRDVELLSSSQSRMRETKDIRMCAL